MKSIVTVLALIAAACSASVGGLPSYEVVEEPVDFFFDADARDRIRVGRVTEELEPHFPEMSWRIGAYEPDERDGLVIQVEERALPDVGCAGCLPIVTAFVVFDRGRQIAIEEFEHCSMYRARGDCLSMSRLVSTIDRAVAESRRVQ